MGKYVLEAKVIAGSNVCQKVYIARLSLTLSHKRIPFKFQQRKFPLVVSTKAISHGQLYVVMS